MSFTKFNKTTRFVYEMPEDAPFVDLDDLYRQNGGIKKYVLRGLFINTKSQFGEHPIALIDNMFVDLPKHLTNVVKEILKDDESIDAINQCKAGFKIRTYKDNKNIERCTVEWIDC